MLRKAILLSLILMLVVGLFPAAVSAQGNTPPRYVQIALWHGSGPAWVYYNADTKTNVVLYYYWYAKTEQQVQDFLDNVIVDITLNGQPLFDTPEDAQIYWGPIHGYLENGLALYRSEWRAMLVPLDPGEYTIKMQLSLATAVEDGIEAKPFGPGLIQNTTNIVTVIDDGAIGLVETETTDSVEAVEDTADEVAPPPSAPKPQPQTGEIHDEPVVGTFVDVALAYWAPEDGKTVRPDMHFYPGQTLWVFGMDSTHQYYKVLLDAAYLWVKVETMGPTSDETWHNDPLPNIVVN